MKFCGCHVSVGGVINCFNQRDFSFEKNHGLTGKPKTVSVSLLLAVFMYCTIKKKRVKIWKTMFINCLHYKYQNRTVFFFNLAIIYFSFFDWGVIWNSYFWLAKWNRRKKIPLVNLARCNVANEQALTRDYLQLWRTIICMLISFFIIKARRGTWGRVINSVVLLQIFRNWADFCPLSHFSYWNWANKS